jgi:integrase
MLRHAWGFALANKGHDTRALQAYLGHKNIQQTVRSTELSPMRFTDYWRDRRSLKAHRLLMGTRALANFNRRGSLWCDAQ